MNEITFQEIKISKKNYNPIAIGFAMFSMFFGAGNSIFPLAIGQYAQDKNFYAILGMWITAIGVPFLGLVSMILFQGNSQAFFSRIGKVPGFILTFILLSLLGPFGATPRCITLSFSTVEPYLPGFVQLPLFSLFSCLVIFLLTMKKNRLMKSLSYFLTPLLLSSLALIIVKGFFLSHSLSPNNLSYLHIFFFSLKEGYLTMDLMAAFFFSSMVITYLKKGTKEENNRNVLSLAFTSSLIGAGLLSIVYFGFSYLGAFYSSILDGVPKELLLGNLAFHILGPIGGIVACIAIALACITTAIALVSISADFIHKECTHQKFSYNLSLMIVLIMTFFVSTLEFQGIAKILQPIVTICYPALIALSILNLAYKLYEFKPVKIPVLIVFLVSLGSYLFG